MVHDSRLRFSGALFAGFVACACARGPNVSSAELPLRRVVVYRNGVGYFERAGSVDADRVTFKMRQRMVGDFLATLAIVERGGSSVRSASFPLEVEDEGGPVDPAFLRTLEALRNPEPEPVRKDDPLREVVLRLDGERHDLAVGYIAETPLWRPSYRLVVDDSGKANLQAWGIVQNLSGEDWSDVELVLVAGAPLAFQSTLGDPVTPPRPVVTDQGEVIQAVPESVTSLRDTEAQEEAPMAEPEEAAEGMAMDEAAKASSAPAGRALKKERLAVPKHKPAPAPPAVMNDMAAGARRSMPESVAPSQPRSMSALAAVAVQGGSTRYAIPGRSTVPDESATMLLLLSEQVPGEAVFLYGPDPGVPDSAEHPFRVARFSNDTKGLLERGPIAVFEKGAFLGQGLVQSLPPGATATVPFALERSLAVQSSRRSEQQGARLSRIQASELVIERDDVVQTTYQVRNGGDTRARLLVRHPRLQGYRLHAPPPDTEDNVGQGNALVPVEIPPGAKRELVVDERRAVQRPADFMSPLADTAVKAYLADTRSDRGVVEALRRAWTIRDDLVAVRDEIRKYTAEQSELEDSARQTRLSLKAIEKNPRAGELRNKLTERLGNVTRRLDELTKLLVERRLKENELEVRFRDAIAPIRLLATPAPRSAD